MTRGNVCAYSMHLVGKRICELTNAINSGNLNVLNGLNMPTQVCRQKYLEDVTNEIRDVTVIEIGLPVQVEICFYL